MNEDREVVVVGEFYGAILFVIEAGGTHIHLDKENARKLRDELNEFLGVDKQYAGRLEPASPWYVGQVFKAGSNEPHELPVGSQLQDDSPYEDIMEKTDDGWEWVKVLGASPSEPRNLNWDNWKNDWDYTLIKLGDA